MNEHAAGRVRRRRGTTGAVPGAGPRRQAPRDLSAPIDAAHRHRQIAEAAYFRAEARGFGADGMLEDWLAAEREVDRGLLVSRPARRTRAPR